MFRTEQERPRVSRALCEQARLEGLWTETGPTERAVALRERQAIDSVPFSHGERLLWDLAWDVWNSGNARHHGLEHTSVIECLEVFDTGNLSKVASLLAALAADMEQRAGGCSAGGDVERWLRAREGRRRQGVGGLARVKAAARGGATAGR